jgi:hypothetical protein
MVGNGRFLGIAQFESQVILIIVILQYLFIIDEISWKGTWFHNDFLHLESYKPPVKPTELPRPGQGKSPLVKNLSRKIGNN